MEIECVRCYNLDGVQLDSRSKNVGLDVSSLHGNILNVGYMMNEVLEFEITFRFKINR